MKGRRAGDYSLVLLTGDENPQFPSLFDPRTLIAAHFDGELEKVIRRLNLRMLAPRLGEVGCR